MAVKTYRKTALVTAEQFLPAIGQIPSGVFSTALGHPSKRPDAEWALETKEARHILRAGDYICTGPAGEQWNVAREIFEATYEEVTTPLPETNVMPAPNEINDMIERLLDAQQEINRSANETMSQPLCDAAALIDELEQMLIKIKFAILAATEGSADVA
ncbi:PGDYG protein [Rhizobium sp. PP-CC-2G-626]|nr:PGDYG protein [Rhizobium sp. PP-CC-2G-626]